MNNRFRKDENGFTGLEAAIVLIAFVVVAAVFSYVMLGAGFFTTQKSQEVVHTGVTQASSSIAPSGDVIVKGFTTAGSAYEVTFYITNTAGGTPVDLDKTILTYTDEENAITRAYSTDGASGHLGPTHGDNGWVYSNSIVVHDDNLLEAGEKIKVVVTLNHANFNANPLPKINEKIKIDLKPPEGAVLTITRTMPPALAIGAYYPVY